MPVFLFKKRFIIALVSAAILLCMSCKKKVEDISINTLEAYFKTNILNKDFIVELAKDGTADKTAEYTGYHFVLKEGADLLGGPLTATKGSEVYTGTWQSNSDYGKLVISLTSPSIPAEFIFLNRPWRFAKKDFPVMQLAPWGSTDPKILHMRRL